MHWIAERFFDAGGERWVDAATGLGVLLHVTRSAPQDDAFVWDDMCSRLLRLRHPLLCPLVDFGAATRLQRFEAYAVPTWRKMPAPHGDRHCLRRTLESEGIVLEGRRVAVATRSGPVGDDHDRCLVWRLQPRPVLDALDEVFARHVPIGPMVVNVLAPVASGMRTTMLLAARAARLRGLVPVCSRVLARFPQVASQLLERHLCIIDDGAVSPRAMADLMARISRGRGRRHVVLRFRRQLVDERAALVVEPMRHEELVSMVVSLDHRPPSREELAGVARVAEGRPGRFVEVITTAYRPSARTSMQVHEVEPPYECRAPDPPPDPPTVGGRVLGAALRASGRATVLERVGRHAAAERVLERAIRVLRGRQRPIEAAACASRLGMIALDRGDLDRAIAAFTLASELAPETACGVRSLVAHGVALTEAARLDEAEALLRGALAAADVMRDRAVLAAATGALARCLFWQRRLADATAVITACQSGAAPEAERARLLAVLARCQAASGQIGRALSTIRESQAAAEAGTEARVSASVELIAAEILFGTGDRTGARVSLSRAVRLARTARLPLIRLRAAILSIAAREAGWPRLLSRLQRLRLPALLMQRLAAAAQAAPVAIEPVSELERLLDLTQRSPDDRTALERICAAIGERLGAGSVAVFAADGRTLALGGRPWRSLTPGLRDLVTCGTRVLPDRVREPMEAAEPIRYGGEIVGAVMCRWPAGSFVDRDAASAVLRAGGLSAAAAVRALLDAAVPTVPPQICADVLGHSPAAASLREAIVRAARAPFPVLIEGESGSGKELVARGIHRSGNRRDRRFCAVNCAALTDELLEAELFGHVRGAFTGAATERTGLFEEADGGTLFLDEVGELSARAQAKLLRVLQEGEVRRVGENMPRRVDVRIVAATNRRLEEEVVAGRFRADLRFRLDVVRIAVPPLRERAADIPLLTAHFWREASERVGSQATLTPEAVAVLSRYDWPGNIRELQNVIAWIAVHSPRRGRVGTTVIPSHVARAVSPAATTFEAARTEFERRFIRAALAGAEGRPSRAAAALGISRQGLAKMMRRLQIETP